MKFISKKAINILLLLLILFISLSIVSAHENTTQVIMDDEISSENVDEINVDNPKVVEPIDTHIEVNDVDSYYKQKCNLVSYLKDYNGTPIKNKQVNIFLNGESYNKTTDDLGKVSLALDLKPNNYKVSIKFAGDENYTSCVANSIVKIKKAPLAIKMSNFNTYVDSDLFFEAKVYNKVTGKAVSGIRVQFKVYSIKTKKYAYYYRTTDKNGIATLNKNLKVGTYKVSTRIEDSKNKKYISYKNSKNKVTMNVKATAETGCCSFYLQVNATESIAGFRRDATNALNIYIKYVKWNGRYAIKQYKLGNSYFFHSITTSDGWMIGTGGVDNPDINRAIENLAGKMVKANKIQSSYLKKIQYYEKCLGLGHFSIKAPDGRFAVVWLNGYSTGKLKPGEYISVPNLMSSYRHGTYDKFSSDPLKAAIKVGATDDFGVNRRDITLFVWKSTTDKNFKTTSSVKTYAANDNGKLVGRSTSYLRDDIYYKNKFVSRYDLPYAPSMKYLGTQNFGNIDKLVKLPTIIRAPSVENQFNKTKYFKVSIKNKKTSKAIVNLKVKIKLTLDGKTKVYTLITDEKGVVRLPTKDLSVGTYNVVLAPANNKYLISGKSTIKIT